MNLSYIEGKKNILADCYSRLPRMDLLSPTGAKIAGKGTLVEFEKLELPKEEVFSHEIFLVEGIDGNN